MYHDPLRPVPKSVRVFFCGLVFGAMSFFAGFIGPIYFTPEANLGPLLGIFITGPLGFLVGLLLGILWSGLIDKTGALRTEMRWLFTLWLMSALLFLFLGPRFSEYALLAVLGLQIAIVIVAGVLAAAAEKRSAVAPGTTRRRKVLLVAAAAMVLMAIFPPVTAVAADPGSEPLITFILDSGLDASRHIPLYAMDFGQLLVRWAVIAVIAVAECLRIARRGRT